MWEPEPHQVLSAGVLLLAVILPALVPVRREPASSFFARQRWGYGGVVIVLVVLTISRFVSPAILLSASGLRLWALEYGLTGTLMIASVWVVVRRSQRHPWQALGFNSRSALRDVLWALRIALGLISVLIAAVILLRVSIPDLPTSASGVDRGAWRTHFLDFIAAFGVAAVLMPLAEEVTFRGLAYGPLLRKFGTIGAACGTAFFWAGTHYSEPSLGSGFRMAWVFVIGVFFAEVYRRRESIIPTATFHIISNTVSVFIGDPHLKTLVPLGVSAIVLWLGTIIAFRCVSSPRSSVREAGARV